MKEENPERQHIKTLQDIYRSYLIWVTQIKRPQHMPSMSEDIQKERNYLKALCAMEKMFNEKKEAEQKSKKVKGKKKGSNQLYNLKTQDLLSFINKNEAPPTQQAQTGGGKKRKRKRKKTNQASELTTPVDQEEEEDDDPEFQECKERLVDAWNQRIVLIQPNISPLWEEQLQQKLTSICTC